MSRKHCVTALLVAGSLVPSAIAQNRSRDDSVDRTLRLLKAPVTPPELWDAVKFSLNVGKHSDALGYLDRLLAGDPSPELLLTIRERDAAGYFPKLAATPELQQRSVELLRMIEQAAQQRARDPERIQKFIDYLTRSPQHRAYGVAQLRHAGPYAVPHLLAALRDPSFAEHRIVVLHSMQKLDTAAVPPLVAALSAPDMGLVADVIEVLSVLGDQDTVPHLRYLAESPKIAQAIQARARMAVEAITGESYAELPSVPQALTQQAERYYKHEVDLKAPSTGVMLLWSWVAPEGLTSQQVTASYAEEYFGMLHCRQALALEPKHEPAQVALLSFALERSVERIGIDQVQADGPGQASSAALVSGAELLERVLDKAIQEERRATALGALRALAKVADATTLAPKNQRPSPVLQALSMPDRRIQFAAAEVVLSLRPQQPVAGTSSVITILAQALSSETTPMALVIDRNASRASALASLVSQAGYDAQFVSGAREGFARAAASADVDLILIDANIHSPELSPTLASFRSDPRTHAIPIVVLGYGDPARTADELELSLRSGNIDQLTGLLHEIAARALESKLDSIAKEEIGRQVTESDRVLRNYVKYAQIAPPHRSFMALYMAELAKVTRQIKLAKPASEARTELLAESERLERRIEALKERLAATNLVPAYAVSYPGARELTKFERRYARVKYLARPNSLEMFKLQLASFLPALDGKPLTAAERVEHSRRAVMWLNRIARGEIRGFDIRPAEPAIIAAMSDDSLGPDAIAAASLIDTSSAQRAVARLILNESASMPLRLEAARQMVPSLRRFGSQLAPDEVARLKEIREGAGEPEFQQAMSAVVGALRPDLGERGERLRGFATPPFEPPAAPEPDAAAVPPNQEESETRP